MGKIDKNKYLFSSSLVRGDSMTFLKKPDYEKIIEAKDVKSAMIYLNQFGYGDGKELENPRDFEVAFGKELKRVYNLVFSSIPDSDALKFVLYQNDFHNIKVILKSEILGHDPTSLLIDNGSIEKNRLLELVKERNYPFLKAEIKDAIILALEEYAKANDPQVIDLVLDKALYSLVLKETLDLSNEFILGYIRLSIDLLNILSFVRVRQIEKPITFFYKVFIDGGRIDKSYFVKAFEESYPQIAERFMVFDMYDIFIHGAENVFKTGEYIVLEKLMDNMKLTYLKKSQFINFGIEPVFSFIYAKEIEIKNLRVVFSGKLMGISNDIIKERMRDSYV